jgi:hypothetical protein
VAHVKTRNVHQFSIVTEKLPSSIAKFVIDGKEITTNLDELRDDNALLHFSQHSPGKWRIDTVCAICSLDMLILQYFASHRAFLVLCRRQDPEIFMTPSQPPGRLQTILTTPSTIPLIIPGSESASTHAVSLGIAQRIAHDLDTYHKLDTVIVQGALEELGHAGFDAVLIGLPSDPAIRELIQSKRTPFSISSGEDEAQTWSWSLNGAPLTNPGQGKFFITFYI